MNHHNTPELVTSPFCQVSLTSSISFPAKLHVSSPNGQQKCGGWEDPVVDGGRQLFNREFWMRMPKYSIIYIPSGMWFRTLVFGMMLETEVEFSCTWSSFEWGY
jgi:hypothetical protein